MRSQPYRQILTQCWNLSNGWEDDTDRCERKHPCFGRRTAALARQSAGVGGFPYRKDGMSRVCLLRAEGSGLSCWDLGRKEASTLRPSFAMPRPTLKTLDTQHAGVQNLAKYEDTLFILLRNHLSLPICFVYYNLLKIFRNTHGRFSQ